MIVFTRRQCYFLFALLASAVSLQAQATFGRIFGTVTDRSGSVVPGAIVTITSVERGAGRTTTTNETGEYSLPDVDLGSYVLSVHAQGFKTLQHPAVTITVKAQIRVDAQLELGDVSQTIRVEASSPLVRTGSAEVSNVISRHELQNLPIVSRNLLNVASLSGGTNGGNPGGRQAGISGAEIIVNGAPAEANNFIIDGVSDNMEFSGTIAILPPIDAVQEFAVQTSQYSAEFGRGAGGLVNMALKSGTNQIHGFGYDYLQNDLLNARPFDFTRTNPAKQALRRNQFGGGAGGPLKKDKIFWFVNYEGIRRPSSTVNQYIVPTLAQRGGDFSQAGFTIYDPATAHTDPNNPNQIVRNPFSGNRIPGTQISAAGAGLLSYYPAPNFTNGTPGSFNYLAIQRSNETQNSVNAKGDFNLTQADTVSLHYSRQRRQLSNSGEFPDGRLGVADNINGDNAGITYTKILSPRLVNEARISYNRLDFPVTLFNTDNVIDQYNIPGWHTLPFGYGFPTVSVTNLSTTAPTRPIQVFPPPFQLVENTYQVLDAVTWQKGAHSIKIGGEVDRIHEDRFQIRSGGGILSFNGSYTTQIVGQSVASPRNGVADMLLGLANSLTTQYAFDAVRIGAYTASGFAQDDWRIAPKFTINFGIRYDFFQPYHENQDRYANLDLATGTRLLPESSRSVVANTLGLPGGALPPGWAYVPLDQVMRHANYKDISPRIGVAYAATPNISFRAGYGIFYAPTSNNTFNNQGTDGNPFFFDFVQTGDVRTPISVASGFPGGGINNVLASPSFGAYYGPLNRPDPYSEKYNANLQWSFSKDWLIDLGYVGQRSLHFPTLESGNQVAQPGPGSLVQRQPYPNIGSFYFYVPYATSNYNGMTFSVTTNNLHGLSLKSVFTYSKALGFNTGSDQQITNRYNVFYDYGPLDYDIPRRWVTSWVYQIPASQSLPKVARAVLANWDVSGIFTLQSGFPFTVNFPGGVLNVGQIVGTGDRPDAIGDPNLPSDQRSISRWFNTAAFQTPAAYTWGNAGKNTVRGPGLTNLDLALQKRVPLPWEGHRLVFRMEGSNLLNHVELGLPGASFGSPTIGVISNLAGGPRTMQAAFRYEF
jgi:hypothetical protein